MCARESEAIVVCSHGVNCHSFTTVELPGSYGSDRIGAGTGFVEDSAIEGSAAADRPIMSDAVIQTYRAVNLISPSESRIGCFFDVRTIYSLHVGIL